MGLGHVLDDVHSDRCPGYHQRHDLRGIGDTHDHSTLRSYGAWPHRMDRLSVLDW